MKLSKQQKADLKKVIQQVEYYTNGFHRLCDGSTVEAVNISVDVKEKTVHYDANVYRPQDSPSKERFDDCWLGFDTIIKNAEPLGVDVSFLPK